MEFPIWMLIGLIIIIVILLVYIAFSESGFGSAGIALQHIIEYFNKLMGG